MNARDWKYINDFSGGEDTRMKLGGANNKLARILNFWIDETGKLEKRNGYIVDNTSDITGATDVDAINRYYHGGEKTTVVAVKTVGYSKIYKSNESANTWSEITGGSSIIQLNQIEMLNFRDTLFICNGNNFQYTSDASTKANVVFDAAGETTLIPVLICKAKNQMFIKAAGNTYKNRVFPTIVDGWTTSPGADFKIPLNASFVIEPDNDLRGITTMWAYGSEGRLVIFSENEMWWVLGETAGNIVSNYSVERVSKNGGCVSPRGVCETDDGRLVFVGNGNVFCFDGSSFRAIGNEIKDLLRRINLRHSECVYIPERQSVMVVAPNMTHVWNIKTEGWSHLDITPDRICRYKASEDNGKVVFAFNGGKTLYQWDKGETDNGADIPFEIKSPTWGGDSFAVRKDVRGIKLLLETFLTTPGTLTLTCDDGARISKTNVEMPADLQSWVPATGGETAWAFVVWEQNDTIITKILRWLGGVAKVGDPHIDEGMHGNTFSLKFTGTGSKPVTIYGIGINATAMEV